MFAIEMAIFGSEVFFVNVAPFARKHFQNFSRRF